jgi:hypothetical protein
MLYKIKNNLVPDYLAELLPIQNIEYITYNLRNNQNISIPYTRLESYRRSFFPSAIRLWNRLSIDIRNSESLLTFKENIKGELPEPNVLYYYGSRWPSVHHARMRIGCSKLNSDLCYKLHVRDDPSCICGADIEDAHHFFMSCDQYNEVRVTLQRQISNISDFNLDTLLYGNELLGINEIRRSLMQFTNTLWTH